jgi:hypothetical protein
VGNSALLFSIFYFGFSFFGRPLKTVQIRRRIQTTEENNFLVENSRVQDGLLKVFSHQSPPLNLQFSRISISKNASSVNPKNSM